MKNVIFISPHFPTNYYRFCRELKNNGLNVLGIGDQNYDELRQELKDCLAGYYKVDDMQSYSEMYRAVAYFASTYGRIDFLESNNEFWLIQDAKLRRDFNIPGLKPQDMEFIKLKSKMKALYNNAGIKTARYSLPKTREEAVQFAREVGYPIVVKPDNGVGAVNTFKLLSDDDLHRFITDWQANYKGIPYIFEEFVNATVNTYDAIIGPKGKPIFETGNVTMRSIMETVNEHSESLCYIHKELPDDMREIGRKTVRAFGVENRFVHLEFFRLDRDQEGLGLKGDIVGLEVNMRPAGVFLPDVMNYANSTDVYKIWADMVAFGSSLRGTGDKQYSIFVGRRPFVHYKLDDAAVMERYGEQMNQVLYLEPPLSEAMGEIVYIASFKEYQAMEQFIAELIERC